ncbi:hypothetical protein DID78_02790 [Candidatus Marinamargulisbacteria bacterium SCGC AG-343-D04]|nr:hypothetical protein DID78_02790 [Candidatus Marinamargulisbacteria bacterium SCGC AG-343-D04]
MVRVFFSFILIFSFCIYFFFHSIHLFLEYERKPLSKVDALVVLSGGTGSRVDLGVDMFKQGVSSTIIFTGNLFYLKSVPQLMRDYAESRGLSSARVILEENSYSTSDHAVNLKPIFEQNEIRSICIVTSKFHTQRAYKVFSTYFSTLDVYVVGSEDGIDYSRWWKTPQMIELVMFEFLKRVYYGVFVF